MTPNGAGRAMRPMVIPGGRRRRRRTVGHTAARAFQMVSRGTRRPGLGCPGQKSHSQGNNDDETTHERFFHTSSLDGWHLAQPDERFCTPYGTGDESWQGKLPEGR